MVADRCPRFCVQGLFDSGTETIDKFDCIAFVAVVAVVFSAATGGRKRRW